MGFIVRLHNHTDERPLMVGRVPSAGDAVAMLRSWREQYPEAWIDIRRPGPRVSGGVA